MMTNHAHSDIELHPNTSPAQIEETRSSKCWQRRTKLEKIFCIVSTIVLITCTGLCIALVVKLCSKENYAVCLTKGCLRSAATIIQDMDETTNPCDDFFQYACGGFVARNDIPDDKTSQSYFSLLQDDVNQKIKVTLEKPKQQSEPECFWKIKDIYKACMNLTRIKFLGTRPLDDLLQSVGGWPVVSAHSWKEDDFDWILTLYKFRKVGISRNYLFSFYIGRDIKNSAHRLLILDQPSVGMPDRAYLLKGFYDPLVNAYYQLMVNSAIRLGATRKDAEEQLKQSLEFEMKLAEFSLSLEERRNETKLYRKMTVGDLRILSSKINWLDYFNAILSMEILSTEPVVVYAAKYLQDAIEFISSSPKRIIANYLMWRVTLDNMIHLDKKFRGIVLEYLTKLTGQTQEPSRWSECVDVVRYLMSKAVGSVYIRKYFNDENTKKSALEMVVDIRRAFAEILNGVSWMTAQTKRRAQQKLLAFKHHIAYPDELLNDKLLDDLYANVSVNPDDHFGNRMSLQNYTINYWYSLLRKPVNKTDWRVYGGAATVNAFYHTWDNSIHFPAGILQGVFFDSDRPRYLNYGAIGSIIGHEITHGFDDIRKEYDKDGNLNNWWDNSSKEMYEQKARCIIEQYGNYTVPENGMKVNGFNTQGENIADNGGLKEAYLAYQKWTNRNGIEPALPGTKLTQQQLFWLSAASVWCGKTRPEQLAVRVMTGAHSPSQFRVNGPMSNSAKFSEDFNCPLGSPMNPLQKCAVW